MTYSKVYPLVLAQGGLVPEGASILGFSPNIGRKTIYMNIYSRKKWSGFAPRQLNSIRTHLSDLTADRYSCEG
jgi:hypothetical protein